MSALFVFQRVRRWAGRAAVAALAVFAGTSLAMASGRGAAPEPEIAWGACLAAIMDCGGCHTPGALIGQPDASRHLGGGDIGFAVPGLGVFFPPNLTSDVATGLGAWEAEEIVRAVREGVRPDGRMLAPAMPWRAYAALNDADAAALGAYLKSLPAAPAPRLGPFGEGEAVPAPYLMLAVPPVD